MNKSENLPFVSVIIPVYNGSRFIERVMAAIRNQSYPKERMEIIVIDNNSIDDSREILGRMQIPHIVCLTKGPAAARNAGIRKAQGSIILFIDHDCISDRELVASHVQAHLKFMQEEPEVKIIGGGIRGINTNFISCCDDFSTWYMFNPGLKPRYEYQYLPTANVSIRKEVFDEIGLFDEKLLVGEDYALCRSALKNNIKLFFWPYAKIDHINRTTYAEFIGRIKFLSHNEGLLAGEGISETSAKIPPLFGYIITTLIMIAEPFYYSVKAGRFSVFLFAPFIILNKLLRGYYMYQSFRHHRKKR